MRKINSLKQLQQERKRIKEHREQLGNKIHSEWKEIKEGLKPVNLVKDIFSYLTTRKNSASLNNETVLKSTFTYAVMLFAKGFADKGIEKLKRFFRK